ncbi:hypothetical protein PULV_a3104 [Pseudoalteromonas ulvae UL12]|uniref:PIN domain-containing protein n=1 Tax=Pseudoalteromonas ulvae TaxID=107327 RepID=UPI00186B8781|nr:PIN domain-containing protein [Pseudoalteromonas ulvae]MBE0362465.1 hypothetical protein [Pseudoalteromonas ulvae UL12]
MHVFLDTNIFYNNWFLTDVRFKLLSHYLNNEEYSLLLSDLVVKEVNNKREQEALSAVNELKKSLKQLNFLNPIEDELPKNIQELKPYDIRDLLGSNIYDILDIPYEFIDQTTVVNRALKSTKPFTIGEKGYRDTLIWLSFLKYIKDNEIEGDIAFITSNSTDFFKKKGKVEFHPSLEEDIKNHGIENKVFPFNNLHNFLESSVDKIANSINKQEFLDDNDSYLMEKTIEFVEQLSGASLSGFLDTPNFHTKLPYIKEIQAEIFEGLEDPEIHSVHQLSDDEVYVDTLFEMRGLTFNIIIDINDYRRSADFIEELYGLYNIELDSDKDIAILGFSGRVKIKAAVEYHLKKNDITQISIEEIYYA